MATISAIPTEFFSANAIGMTDIVAQGFNPGRMWIILLTLGYKGNKFNPGI